MLVGRLLPQVWKWRNYKYSLKQISIIQLTGKIRIREKIWGIGHRKHNEQIYSCLSQLFNFPRPIKRPLSLESRHNARLIWTNSRESDQSQFNCGLSVKPKISYLLSINNVWVKNDEKI